MKGFHERNDSLNCSSKASIDSSPTPGTGSEPGPNDSKFSKTSLWSNFFASAFSVFDTYSESSSSSDNSFRYGEELHFSHPASGKPVIAYSHKTWKLDSGQPMHSESGYWRPKPDGSLEVVIAQSTGLAEVLKGTYSAEDNVIKLHSQVVANASKVREISRVYEMVNGDLHYVVQMATNLTTLQPHLKAVLKKLP